MKLALAWIGVLAVTAGCDQLFGVTGVDLQPDARAGNGDAPLTPPSDSGPCTQLGMNGSGAAPLTSRGFYSVCPFAIPPAISLGPPLSTDKPGLCNIDLGDPTACGVLAASFDIEDDIVVDGSKSLVLIARDTITIRANGRLDVSNIGVPWAACATTRIDGDASEDGGAGGTLDSTRPGAGGGMAAGEVIQTLAPTESPITSLHNGCPGGAASGTTARASGGGAVYLIAGATIDIAGTIQSNGGDGGGGSMLFGGGGGGGTGGMIAFDTPDVELEDGSFVYARGGGGGAGGSGNAAGQSATGSMGGPDDGSGDGSGGNGFANDVAATIGGNAASTQGKSEAGGGGGGGGAGEILMFTPKPVSGFQIDPPAIN